MKKIIFTGLLAMGTFMSNAQTFTYNTSAGWSPNIVNLYTTTACPGGVGATTPHTTIPGGSILINTTSGRVEYTQVRGAHESRISNSLGNAYDENYNMDFTFNISQINSNGPLIYLAAMSSLNRNPFYDVPMITCGAGAPMDLLGIICSSNANGTELNVQAETWDNGVRITTNTANIPIAYNTTYYASTRVYNNGMGELFLFSNPNRTTLFGRICFSIPSTINQLTFLQHATHSGGGTTRRTTAWVDSTAIYQNTNPLCCQMSINGPNVICDELGHPTTPNYTVTTTGTPPTYSVSPSDVEYTVNSNGSITITSFGTMPATNPKVVTITATSICKCEPMTATKNIYFYGELNATFDIDGLSSSGSALTDFDAISTEGSATTIHQWEIMFSNSSSTPGALVRPVYTSTGAGSTFEIVSSTPTALVTGTYYLVRHTMSNQSGLCGPAVYTRLIFISTKMMMIDLGDISDDNMTQEDIERRVEDFNNGIKTERLIISPNPTAGKFNIKSDVEMHTVVLMDANGKVIETVNKRSDTITLDLSNLERGAYLIKVITEDGTQLERIIKQ